MTTASSVDLELARALSDLARDGGAGILTAKRGKLKRLFCFRDGRLAFATSNIIEEQFSEHLVRNGLVSVGALAAAAQSTVESDSKLTRALVDRGAIDEEAMTTALESHSRELLFSTLDWSDGDAVLERGTPDLEGEVLVALSTASLLLAYARERPTELTDVKARIGSSTARLVLQEERIALLQGVDTGPVLHHMLRSCDGTTAIDELVAAAPGDDEAKWRAVYAALLVGIVEATVAEHEPASDVERQEVLTRIERAENATHYGILELSPSVAQERIRDAYYVLARKYHPDRFRAGSLSDLLQSIEGYFSRVTEAYNTLYNPRLRQAYDEHLAAKEEKAPEQDTAYLARENFRLGRALIAKGRFTDAVTSLENAVKLDGRNAAYRLELGQLLARNPRLRRQAEQQLIEVNRIDPALADGYMALGDLYMKGRRSKDAIRLFQEVLRWEPGHIEATERLKQLGA
jgi:curved DNA-binding protein CbpA